LLNLPNILTLSRIAIIPIVLATFFFDSTAMRWTAVSLFTLAGITDFFDGHLARRAKQVSRLGRFLDPIADKLLIASVLLVLVGFNRVDEWTYIPAIVIMLREILVSGLREFLAELRVGLPVTKLAKSKTTVQMIALGFLIVGTAVPLAKPTGEFLLWLAALLTMITGYDYLKAGLKHMSEPAQTDISGAPDDNAKS
jgi:cardiolipin synthase